MGLVKGLSNRWEEVHDAKRKCCVEARYLEHSCTVIKRGVVV
jgi:hypothetical protein